MDSNIPKSTVNAAKIFYKLQQDDIKLSDRFQKSPVVKYLSAIPHDKLDDQFNPFQVKDKWTKFFRSGNQRAVVDTERALKNSFDNNLRDFIRDKKH